MQQSKNSMRDELSKKILYFENGVGFGGAVISLRTYLDHADLDRFPAVLVHSLDDQKFATFPPKVKDVLLPEYEGQQYFPCQLYQKDEHRRHAIRFQDRPAYPQRESGLSLFEQRPREQPVRNDRRTAHACSGHSARAGYSRPDFAPGDIPVQSRSARTGDIHAGPACAGRHGISGRTHTHGSRRPGFESISTGGSGNIAEDTQPVRRDASRQDGGAGGHGDGLERAACLDRCGPGCNGTLSGHEVRHRRRIASGSGKLR